MSRKASNCSFFFFFFFFFLPLNMLLLFMLMNFNPLIKLLLFEPQGQDLSFLSFDGAVFGRETPETMLQAKPYRHVSPLCI